MPGEPCFREDCKWFDAEGKCALEDFEEFEDEFESDIPSDCPRCFEKTE